MIHRRWMNYIIRKICLHDRVMVIDIKIPQKNTRFIVVYLPHIGYDWNYFLDIFNDIKGLVMEAMDKRYTLVLIENFNLTLTQ